MTIAYWCVLVAAYLPIVWTAAAKFSGGNFAGAGNRAPREFLERLSGWRKRSHWAQLNGFGRAKAFRRTPIEGGCANRP